VQTVEHRFQQSAEQQTTEQPKITNICHRRVKKTIQSCRSGLVNYSNPPRLSTTALHISPMPPPHTPHPLEASRARRRPREWSGQRRRTTCSSHPGPGDQVANPFVECSPPRAVLRRRIPRPTPGAAPVGPQLTGAPYSRRSSDRTPAHGCG
jgi:hypothetical protein